MAFLTMRIVVATAVAAAGLSVAAPAAASEGWGINGTYASSSNGEWASINDRLEKQPSTVGTWHISTTCTSPTDCVGTVTSDAGWTAPIYTTSGFWYIRRVVQNWRYCEDGSPIDGQQIYKFYAVGPTGMFTVKSDEYTGQDQTMGPSGSCGRNKPPVVKIPFYMKKI
jgi:hypothetical protein